MPVPTPDFRTLFEFAPGLYLVLTEALVIVAVSEDYLRATMTKREEILERGLFDVFPDNPDDLTATGVSNLRSSLNRVIENRIADSMAVQKYDIRRPESEGGGFEERYWSPSNFPVLGTNGEIIYIIHRVEDVTAYVRLTQKSIEQRNETIQLTSSSQQMEQEILRRAQALQEANHQLRKANGQLQTEFAERHKTKNFLGSLVENLPLMIFVKEARELRFIKLNRAGEDLLGYPEKELIGKNDYDFFPKEEADWFIKADRRVLEGKKLLLIEEESIRIKSGEERVLRTRKVPLFDQDGAPQYLLGISEDITEFKKTKKTFREIDQRFRLLIDGVQDYAIFMIGPMGNLMSWNKGAQRISGYEAEEVIGKNFSIFYTPEDQANGKPEKELKAALDQGRVEDEGYRVRKNGQRYWAHVIMTSVFDEDNKLQGFAKVTRDMTERKETEQALRAQTHIMNLVNDSVVMRDLNDRITYWNQGAQRVYGWTAAQVLGKLTQDLLKTQFPTSSQIAVQKQLMSEEHWEGELVHTRKDGSEIMVLSRQSVQKDANNQAVAVLELNYDITDRKRIEKDLQDKNEQLQNTAEAKDQFLANMSHELRTPLNGIIGFSEFLVDGKPGAVNPKQKEYLEDILNSGKHLLQLISDILDLSKVGAGKMEFYPERFSLLKAVQETCAVSNPIAQKRGIQINVAVAPETDDVTLDQQKFKQVLYNLISNAIKFNHDGGKVGITVEPYDAERFKLVVTDNGIGIKAEDVGRLFKKFDQLDSGATRRHEGTGLGLALTSKIVELQGGEITMESEVGKGSSFTVVLPFVYNQVQPTVLVVDDDLSIQELFKTFLKKIGFSRVVVGTAKEAISSLLKQKFDLMFLDLQLPDAPGDQVYENAKQCDPNLKVVVITGYSDREVLNRILQISPVTVLQKPLKIEQLNQIVKILGHTMTTVDA
jgi:PAS domain S-box-containing protein